MHFKFLPDAYLEFVMKIMFFGTFLHFHYSINIKKKEV